MKPEHDQLIRDLFARNGLAAGREEVLLAGSGLLRRRRTVRRLGRASPVMATVFLAAIAVWRVSYHQSQPPAAVAAASPKATMQIKVLTDNELLALFPNTPVALAKIGNKEKLIFPRPGDEARFITRIPAVPDHAPVD